MIAFVLALGGCVFSLPDCPDCVDQDGDGLSGVQGDCDDTEPAVAAGLDELCDGLDNDCDGVIDDGWYPDRDGDGFPDPARGEDTCGDSQHWVRPQAGAEWDCDDSDDQVHPGATELCNYLDDDCDALIDEDVTEAFFPDADRDGFPSDAVELVIADCVAPEDYMAGREDGLWDCDDADATAWPGAVEVFDGADDDCDGLVDQMAATAAAALTLTGESCSGLGGDGQLAALGQPAPGHVGAELGLVHYYGSLGRVYVLSAAPLGELTAGSGDSWPIADVGLADIQGTLDGVRGYLPRRAVGLGGSVVGLDEGADDVLVLGWTTAWGRDGGRAWILDGDQPLKGSLDVTVAQATIDESCPDYSREQLISATGVDIDGDGIPEVAVGKRQSEAPTEPCDLWSEIQGQVALFSADDLEVGGTLTTSSASLTLTGDGDPTYLGSALTAADLDGDGFDELIVGAQDGTADGAVYVLSGLELAELLGEDRLDLDSAALGTPISGAHAGLDIGGEGSLPRPGDLDGDGLPDLVISPDHDTDSGSVHVFMGFAPGVATALDDASVVVEGAGDEGFGHEVLADVDLDGDGVDELVVGAPGAADPDGAEGAGVVRVFHLGGAVGTVVDQDQAEATLWGGAGEALGSSLAGGEDFDGDGIDDILLGAPGHGAEDCSGDTGPGAALLLLGFGGG